MHANSISTRDRLRRTGSIDVQDKLNEFLYVLVPDVVAWPDRIHRYRIDLPFGQYFVLLAMAAFSLVMSISPGPVYRITLSLGANSGIRNALPIVSGATIGFTRLLFLIGMGLGEFTMRAPYFMATY